jgi:DNA-binding transcriptional MerR regulator
MSVTEAPSRRRLLTIGAVCSRLKDEFPDVSISKIRYLEDQGLLNPRRTQGGYRLFSEDDVERLETILRLQRDEDGQRLYAESEADIAAACEALARFGIGARNLRAFRTAADREGGLLEAVIAPALRSRSPERRQAALGDLQRLAQSAQELADLLLRRNVRRLVE